MNTLETFHFLRPWWLLSFIPLAILLWRMWRKRLASRSWKSVVDAQLLPHLLIGESTKQNPWAWFAIAVGATLAIVSMAGPAWRKLDVPVFSQKSALVVALDMSRSMDAADIKPSRIERAKLKLTDILRQQKEGETALIVFAGDAFVVSPLTTDANTIISQLHGFTTDLMPVQGSRPDLAIDKAEALLVQAGSAQGGVLLITDGIDAAYDSNFEKAAKHLAAAGHRLSIMGVGTTEGAPIPTGGGGFLKSDSGSIVLPRLDQSKLNAVAGMGGGTYRSLSNDNSDINALLPAVESSVTSQKTIEAKDMKSDQWQDEGPWLLLPLLVLGAFAFRRGYWMFVLVILLQPLRPAEAMDWNSLWQNADQRGQHALAAQQPKEAAKLFNDPNWRAAANYKAGNYQAALDDLKSSDSAQALYNRGNALAKSGQLGEAIAAYDAALKKDSTLDDAKFNRDLLKKIQEQQKQNEQNKSSQSKDGKPDDKKDESSQQKNSPQQSKDQKPSDQGKDGDKKDGKQQDANKPNDASKPAADKNASDPKKNDGKQPDQAKNSPKDAGNADQKKAEDAKDKGDKPQSADNQNGKPADKKDNKQNDKQASIGEDKLPSKEQQQADKQWLQRIPDDPGGLWRNKFLYQYKQNGQLQDRGKQSW